MAINWEMGVSDPMKGINTGLASLGQALQQQKAQEMQQQQMTRQNSLTDLQLQQGRMTLAKGQRDLTNQNDLQALIQSQNGRTTPVTTQVPNPAFTGRTDAGLAQAQADNAGEWTPSAVDVMRQAQGLPDQGQAPQAEPAQIPQTTQQPMDERAKALETQNFLKERGMFDQLKEMATATNLTDKIDTEKRKQMAHVQAAGQMGYLQARNNGGTEADWSVAGKAAAIQQAQALGMPTTGMENSFYGNNIAWSDAPPEIGGKMATTFGKDGSLEVKHYAPVKDAEGLLDKRLAATAAENEKNRAAADERLRKTMAAGMGPKGGKLGMTMNGLSAEQTSALSTAIAEGRLAPYKINSKNQQILADTAIQNPGIDLNNIDANLGLARNKDVQMKGAIAETVTPLLKSIVENGKKLNYSDNQYIGKVQQWYDKKSNDPQFVKYMSLRNDQLLTLGGIMRSNGMTDMAQRLEEEAAQPTMSPRALDGWLAGQMESVAPRLEMYRSIRSGKGAPQPNQGGNVRKIGKYAVEVH